MEVGPDGTVRFEVPGAAPGVKDEINAWIEGTPVRRQWSYVF
jgi:hypothetical protein